MRLKLNTFNFESLKNNQKEILHFSTSQDANYTN